MRTNLRMRKIKNGLALLFCMILMLPSFGVVKATTVTTDFTIDLVSVSPTGIYKGSTNDYTLLITNTSGSILTGMLLQVQAGAFSVSNAGSVINVGDFTANGVGASKTKVLKLVYDGSDTNKMNLSFTYSKAGVAATATDYLTVNTTPEDTTPTTPADPATYKPVIRWTDSTMPILPAGTSTEVSFKIKNMGNYPAKDLIITPQLGTDLSGKVSFDTMTLIPTYQVLNNNEEKTFKLKVTPNATIASGMYPITLHYEYSNYYGATFKEDQITYIKITNAQVSTDSISVTSHTLNPVKPVIGKSLVFTQTIYNKLTTNLKDVKVWIEGLPADSFQLTDSVKEQSVNINGFDQKTVSINYILSDVAKGGSYPYKLMVSYVDATGNTITKETAYNVFVESATAKRSAIKVENLTYPKSGVNAEGSFTVSFDIVNKGATPAYNVKVALTNQDVIWSKSSSVLTYDEIPVGGKQTVTYQLVSSKDATTKNYPLIFKVSYFPSDKIDAVEASFDQVVGVYVEGSTTTPGAISTSIPKIIVSSYVADPAIINAGTEFDLKMSFLNTHSAKEVRNIKAYITVDATSKETSNNVFTPVNGSNTFYYDTISPKGTVDQSIRLYAVPDADPKTYQVTINFEYEDEAGTQYSAKEYVGVKVKQPTKLDVTDIAPPTESYVGQGFPVSFNLYNTGKVKLYNLMVKAVGDFTVDNPTYYIGNFEPGSQEYYEGYVTPNMAGELTGQIIISYDDPVGEHIEIVKDFKTNVIEMAPMEPMPDGGMIDPGMVDPNAGTGKSKWLIIGGVVAGLIVAAGIAGVVIRKRILKKKGLSFDEE